LRVFFLLVNDMGLGETASAKRTWGDGSKAT